MHTVVIHYLPRKGSFMYCAYTQCVHRSPERRRCGRTAASALVTADLRLHVPSISASQVQYLSLDDYLLHIPAFE